MGLLGGQHPSRRSVRGVVVFVAADPVQAQGQVIQGVTERESRDAQSRLVAAGYPAVRAVSQGDYVGCRHGDEV